MKNKIIFISLTTVVLLGIALGVVEAHFRNVRATAATGDRCRTSHPILHHVLIANSHCIGNVEGWKKVDYQMNSFGMRDREYTPEKPDGTFRILMLGDSFTEGGGVELEETFSKIVEKKLQDKFTGKKIEVMNAGVGSYSPALEYNYLKEVGIKFSPDLVILNYDQTDLQDDANYEEWLEKGLPEANLVALKNKPWGKIVDALLAGNKTISTNYGPESKNTLEKLNSENPALFLPVFKGLQQFLLNNLESYRTLVKQVLANKGEPGIYFVQDASGNQILAKTVPGIFVADPLIHSREFDLPDFDNWFALSEKNLLLTRDLLKEKNIPFLITVYPIGIQVNGEEWGEGRKLHFFENGKTYTSRIFESMTKFGERENIPVYSALADFKNSSEKPLFYSYDGHFTAKGQQVMGEGLYKYLINTNLVIFD